MPTKANGAKQADLQRVIRACRREGVPKFEYHSGGATIVIWVDDDYPAKLVQGQPSAPDVEMTEEERRKLDLTL